LSPSQIIVIQIYYLSFLKAELRLAGRCMQFQRTYIAITEENIEKQLFRLKNVPCFGRIVFIEKIKQTPMLK
jgi:hypothetical protein